MNEKSNILYSEDGSAVKTLYVTSLGRKVKQCLLFEYFSTFGHVENVRIHNPDSSGWVTFVHPESAAKALKVEIHEISGKRITVAVADDWHKPKPLNLHNFDNNVVGAPSPDISMESTSETTQIMDLNDDCLREIFKFLKLTDLCTVAEASTKSSIRLKAISNEMFERSHKIWHFSENPVCTSHEAKRIFSNFGFLISKLKIDYPSSWIGPSFKKKDFIDWVITYCSNSRLESLEIERNDISKNQTIKLKPLFKKLRKLYLKYVTIEGDGRILLAYCESLIDLDVKFLNDHGIILENTFPKLEQLTYIAPEYINLENFISRHKNLKTLRMWSDHHCSKYMSIIADNCRKLNKLEINVSRYDQSFKETALLRILTLEYLNELTIHCHNRNITKFIKNLSSLKSLHALSLFCAHQDSEFLTSLAQLKQIRRLVLLSSVEFMNLDPVGGMDQLTHLSIIDRWGNGSINFDIVKIIKRLNNLKSLVILLNLFKMDKEMYVRIVNVIRERSARPQYPLQIFCEFNDNFVDSKDHHHIVRMHPATCGGETLIDSSFIFFYYCVD